MRLKGEVTSIYRHEWSDSYSVTLRVPVTYLFDGAVYTDQAISIDQRQADPDPIGTVRWVEILPPEDTE